MSTEQEDEFTWMEFAWVFGGIIMDDAHELELKIASNIAREICGESIIDNDEWFYVTQDIQICMHRGYVIIIDEY